MATSILQEAPVAQDFANEQPNVSQQTVRVLHVITGEFYAGAERVQDLLALNLGDHGYEVGFACLKPGQFVETRLAQNAPLYEVPMKGRFDLRPVWHLVKIIRREGYQLLHAHTTRSALIASLASRIAGVPLVCHIHSPASRDTTNRLKNWVNTVADYFSLRRAAALIGVSFSLGRHICKLGFREEKVSVVPNGVPCREAIPARPQAKTSWTIGTVALFRPRKGIEVLLQALSVLRLRGLDIRLRAVGGFETPEYEREIRELCTNLNLDHAVDWTGFTTDVNAELSEMDLFVLPSLFGEGLPMVVLEAMAAGLPVVATRVEGIPEAIRDGHEGLIAEPGDAQDLAEAIRLIAEGEADWHWLRENAIERHASRFSETSMAAGVAKVYREVLGV